MGRINFDTFEMSSEKEKSDICEKGLPAVISADSVEVVNAAPVSNAAGGLAVIPIIDSVIKVVDDLIKCSSAVAIERQRTKQIQAQAAMYIEAAQQETKRVEIMEKEKTKRFEMECEKELLIKKMELEQCKKKYKENIFREKNHHIERMELIKTIQSSISGIVDIQELWKKRMLNSKNEEQTRVYEEYLNQAQKNITIVLTELEILGKL